jgi:hypothetical protein
VHEHREKAVMISRVLLMVLRGGTPEGAPPPQRPNLINIHIGISLTKNVAVYGQKD